MKSGILKYACLISVALWVLIPLSTDAFAQTDRGMGVSPDALPKALRDLSPKDFPISTNQKKVGLIHALEGKAVVVHRTTNEAFFAMEGDPIHEKDAIHTLADSRCRIRFLDEDVVTMAPDAEFSVESFEDQRAEGKKSSLFSMARGKAMFYALRLFRYRDTRFNVNTPTVTVGVRGTSFGVDVYSAGEKERAESKGVLVADLGNEIAPYLAQVVGPPFITNAFSLDGSLVVAGQFVGPGQMFNGQTNQIIPTPPNVILNFQQATGMGVQGQQSRSTPPGGTGGGTQPLIGTGGLQNLANLSDLTSLVTNQTSVQTGVQTEQANKQGQIVPYTGTLYGYFATLLHKNPFQDAFLNYQSGYSPGEFYNGSGSDDIEGNFRAHGVLNSSDYLKSTGAGGLGHDEAYIGGQSGAWGESWNGVEHWVGQNDYAQWGYWSAPSTSFTVGSNTYSLVKDQAWFVLAKHITTETEIAAVKTGDYIYGGVAHGTYYNGSASASMSGSFSSTVHFGSASVKTFDLNVSGEGRSASYSWSGTQPITYDSSYRNYFAITSGGTAKIDGSTVSYGKVSGSLVGSGAEGMIGAWGMGSSGGPGAAGIYSGTRK